nr:11284_t:CDS:2 [Entrophospora candida]
MNQKLRIASFNIRYDSKGIDPSPRATNEGFIINQKLEKRQAKEQPWNIRKYKVADTILFHKIDIVGIQEAIYSQIKDLESLLAKNNDDDWGWVGVGRHDGKPDGNEGGEFTPIFYNKNRLKLLDFEHFWLSETPNVPNSMGWDAALTRVATQARFQNLQTNSTFYHINTHFDHLGIQARSESAKFIVNYTNNLLKSTTTTKTSIVFFTGDLNCNESDEPYKIITGDKTKMEAFVDTRYKISGEGKESYGHSNTFTGFNADVEHVRIDFILVHQQSLTGDNIKIINHGVMENQYDDGLYISDHRPVIADILFI